MRVAVDAPRPPGLLRLPRAALAPPHDHPFMNNMDEISYWVYTKRAPCLFNYDNVVKKQAEQAHCSKTKPASVQSVVEEVPSPKKKKRKLKIMDDDSVSTEKQQNVYFETSQNQKTAPSSCKSETIGSNVDFNIKQSKPKKIKLQKNCQTSSHKKNKVVTSTPKVTHLRRSLRKAQQNNNNSQLNSSFEIFNASIINGNQINEALAKEQLKSEKLGGGDQNKSKVMIQEKGKNDVLNGQFEDLSDVSGFTANYIRSTKIQSKTPRKLRNRSARTLIKDMRPNLESEDKMIVCVNKSVNTGLPNAVLNCSTDSSQNVINLVTQKTTERSSRANKSTSMLKFIDTKIDDSKEVQLSRDRNDKRVGKSNLNLSFQSRSSGTSRYPKRQKYNSTGTTAKACSKVTNTSKRNSRAHKTQIDDSERKENSEDKFTSRTRSGKKIGITLNLDESGCSYQLNNSNEQVSSSAALNVASPVGEAKPTSTRRLRSRRCRDRSGQEPRKDSVSDKSDKKNPNDTSQLGQVPKCIERFKKSLDRTGQSLRRDSLRDKSGFAACFSDSDSDSEPLKQKKFFC